MTTPTTLPRFARRMGLLATGSLVALAAAPALAADTLDGAIAEGKPIIDLTARYEQVDQDGFAEDAKAPLLRARLGYETGSWNGLSLLFDFDFIRAADDHYNSTVNGQDQYPTIADPEGDELNRLQLSYTGLAGTRVDLGRQRVILDNARFIGNVGWRLNEQTYDAIFLSNSSIKGLAVKYGYIDKVHRVFGPDSPQGAFESNSHIINVSYTGLANTTITAYAYLLDLTPATLDTSTFGIRAVGKYDLGGVALGYTGEYAHQVDRADNPNDFSLDYYLLSASAGAAGLTGSVSYEVLSGDGTVGFSTPLATLHAFQGWADVFLTTPATGITDLYGQLTYKFGKLSATAVYHDFGADFGPGSLGHEFDAVLNFKVSPKVSALIKYADYSGPAGGPASRTKTWVALSYAY